MYHFDQDFWITECLQLLMSSFFSYLTCFGQAQDFYLVVDHYPSPQQKVSLVLLSKEYMSPPALAIPGFPFEAPWKKTVVIPCCLHQLWNISSLSLSLHSGLSWGFPILWIRWVNARVPSQLFSSCCTEESSLSFWEFKVSRRRPFAFAATMLGVQTTLLNIC